MVVNIVIKNMNKKLIKYKCTKGGTLYRRLWDKVRLIVETFTYLSLVTELPIGLLVYILKNRLLLPNKYKSVSYAK